MTRHALAIASFCAGLCSVTLASSVGEVRQNAGGAPATIPQSGSLAAPTTSPQDEESIRALLQKLEQVGRSGDPDAYLALVAATADKSRARDFAAIEFRRGATRLVILERDREAVAAPLGPGLSVIVDAFLEFGARGRVATWQLDLTRTGANDWAVANQQRLSSVDNLYRLFLNPDKQFFARDFRIRAEDMELTLAEGSVFTVDTDEGVTALVLVGKGTMRFHPAPQGERRQIQIFAGSEVLESRFDAAYVRLGQVATHADMTRLTEGAVDPREFRRADLVFREESAKSFAFDLSEFSSDAWTLLPGRSDFLAEVRTRRFGTLTYSRAESADEDISVFDRSRQKNISVYASAERLRTRGPFSTSEDLAYDVRDYDIDLAFDPGRLWLDGRAQLRITIGAAPTNQLRLHLAPSLNVRSVTSERFGRLFSIRVRNQDTLLVTLPVLLLPQADITITVTYSGPLGSQPADWEMLADLQREVDPSQDFPGVPRPVSRLPSRYLYSNRSFWYPRPAVADYATATLRVTVPATFECLASGRLAAGSPALVNNQRKRFEFTADRPLRYLSFFVTRLSAIESSTITFRPDENGAERARDPATGGASYNTLNLAVFAHAGLATNARDLGGRAGAIAQFYQSIVGDSPYSNLTVALLEGIQPGGHSPGYFAILSQPPVDQPRFWRNDPAAFDKHIDFFPAHEIAHQWWGQAVGWSTYHDQWLSEGFAQYFAALYVGHSRGDIVFRSIMSDMRDWALRRSDQGPVFLGYRLGHVRDDSRVFRALIYNKGAAVLHMLRRFVGDDAFFAGIRQFYAKWRYQKAATEDLRHAMEAASGRSLQRFFQRWIYDSTLPQLTFSYRVQSGVATGGGREILLRIDQSGDLFDLPVTVILQYADRPPEEVILAVTDQTTEKRVALNGTLRRVDISKEDGTLAEVKK